MKICTFDPTLWLRVIISVILLCGGNIDGFNLAPHAHVCRSKLHHTTIGRYDPRTAYSNTHWYSSSLLSLNGVAQFMPPSRRGLAPAQMTSTSVTSTDLSYERIGTSDKLQSNNSSPTALYSKGEASPLVLSAISAVIGYTTALLVFQTKSVIFGMNRSILAKLPYLLPIIAGVLMTALIKVEPNIRKSPLLPIGDEIEKYPVMWRQLLFRWAGAIISMGGGAALGTAGMSAEIGMLITYLLLMMLGKLKTKITPMQQRMLLLSASAAGAAANFNAPITGVIYALEITSKLLPMPRTDEGTKDIDAYNKKMLLLMALATTFSTLYIRSGFFVPPFKPSLDWGVGLGTSYNALQTLVLYGLMGVLSGILFKIFAQTRNSFANMYSKFGDSAGPLIAGIITAATGTPQSIPTGFLITNKIVANSVSTMEAVKFFVSKYFAVSSAAMSGFLGGQIAPLIFVGSGFGALFYRLLSSCAPNVLQGHNINAFGVICGAALVGCNFNNIYFPTVLIAEMTRSMEPTLGVLLATAVATLIVKM